MTKAMSTIPMKPAYSQNMIAPIQTVLTDLKDGKNESARLLGAMGRPLVVRQISIFSSSGLMFSAL
jgi:hypothetical protein